MAVAVASALAFAVAYAIAAGGEAEPATSRTSLAEPVAVEASTDKPAIASLRAAGPIPRLEPARKREQKESPPTTEPQTPGPGLPPTGDQPPSEPGTVTEPQDPVVPQGTPEPVRRATPEPTFDPDPQD